MIGTSTIGRIGMVALAFSMGVGLASAPATAAPTESGGQLNVYRDPADPGTTRVTMSGLFPMSQADAQGFLNNIYTGKEPGGMEYVIFGDDEGDRDPVQANFWATGTDRIPGYSIGATSTGLAHTLVVNVPNGYLNDDDGEDELYLRATFVDADGGRRTQFSNLVKGNW
jgi:hypothetical protein